MTMQAPVLVGGASSTADAASYNTASYNPPAQSRVLVFVASGKASNLAEAATSVTHPSIGALTKVGEIAIPNNNIVLTVWTGIGTGTTGVFTIAHGNVMDNCLWQVVRITSDVATPTVQRMDTMATATSGSLGATLSPAPSPTAHVIGVFAYNSTSDTPTVGAGFTAIGTRLTASSPVAALHSEYDSASPASDTAPFTFGATSGKALAAIEVRDGVVTPTGPDYTNLTYWDGTTEVPVLGLDYWDGTTLITNVGYEVSG